METNREERLKYIEAKLHECEADLERLQNISVEISGIIRNAKELSDYYTNEYMDDYERSDKFQGNYDALNQDSIWNVISEQHAEKIRLIKKIINSVEC